jgi:hypothetical protein
MRWVAVALAALAAAACGGPPKPTCSATGSLEVTLIDTDSDDPLCMATVTLAPSSGGTAVPLMPEGGTGAGCYYFTAVTPGEYTLSASSTGYMTLIQSLTVTTDGCSTESPQLSLELLPTM